VVRTDVSGQAISHIFKGQAVFLDNLPYKLSKNQLLVCRVATISVNSGHISAGSSKYFWLFPVCDHARCELRYGCGFDPFPFPFPRKGSPGHSVNQTFSPTNGRNSSSISLLSPEIQSTVDLPASIRKPPVSTSDVLSSGTSQFLAGFSAACQPMHLFLPLQGSEFCCHFIFLAAKNYRQLSLDRVGCRAGVGDIVRRHMLLGFR